MRIGIDLGGSHIAVRINRKWKYISKKRNRFLRRGYT